MSHWAGWSSVQVILLTYGFLGAVPGIAARIHVSHPGFQDDKPNAACLKFRTSSVLQYLNLWSLGVFQRLLSPRIASPAKDAR